MPIPHLRRRLTLSLATLLIIVAGTALRLTRIGLPAGLVKYGGSVLWGAMVYAIVALLLASRRARTVAAVALAVAAAVELFRLVHTPGLDAFRPTLAGQLLLGRIFSPWNLVAYAGGILVAALIDRAARREAASPPNARAGGDPRGRRRPSRP